MKRKWVFGCGVLFLVAFALVAYALYPLVDAYYDFFYPALDRGQCSLAATRVQAATPPSGMIQDVGNIAIDRESLLPITLSNVAKLAELTTITIKSDYRILDFTIREDNTLTLFHYNPGEYTIRLADDKWENIIFTPDRDQFILRESVGSDTNLRLCDIATAAQVAYLGGGYFITFSPQGTVFAASIPSGIRLWKVNTGDEIGFIGTCRVRTSQIKFNVNGTIGAFGCENHIEIWDMQNLKLISNLDGRVHETINVAFSSDEKIFAFDDENNEVHFWGISADKNPGESVPGN